jgi:transcription elongation factor Elf1
MEEQELSSGPIKVYPEICCEICNETIHNHMDCPCCKKYTSTDAYFDLQEHIGYNAFIEIECEECGARFRMDAPAYPYGDGTWIQVPR